MSLQVGIDSATVTNRGTAPPKREGFTSNQLLASGEGVEMPGTTVRCDITEQGLVLRVTLGSPQSMNIYRLRNQIRRQLGAGTAFVTTKLRDGELVTRQMKTVDLLALLEATAAGRDDSRVERRLKRRGASPAGAIDSAPGVRKIDRRGSSARRAGSVAPVRRRPEAKQAIRPGSNRRTDFCRASTTNYSSSRAGSAPSASSPGSNVSP